MEMDRHDAMLMELLKETKTIVGFLDSVFGFLARRTDFYHVMNNETDNIGFLPGIKEKLVFNAIKKNERICNNGEQLPEDDTPYVAEQVEIECSDEPVFEHKNEENKSRISEKQGDFQPIEYYNGAVYENYCWGQSISDLEIHIRLPEHIHTPKLLEVKIEPDYIEVSEVGNASKVLLKGKLARKCRSTDAVWSLSGGKMQIMIDKIQEVWWDRFLENEPSIDFDKMDCSRPIEDLPEESQAVIEKLRWDQQQKMLALPTSEELKNRELLRSAWDAEGSPFKGQPFDPSIVKFN